jgi:hypothetical protein
MYIHDVAVCSGEEFLRDFLPATNNDEEYADYMKWKIANMGQSRHQIIH